ncbi:uncharacterized protein METZ01_LOCUS340454, partial [marine metagenome]
DLVLDRGDKVALIGPNGAGKSTMLKVLAGVLDFDSGTRRLGHNVVTGYYAQHLLELLNVEKTLIQELQQVSQSVTDQSLKNILGGFLFGGDDINKTISVLSGGEKARIALAKLLIQQNNLLFMDEPTNHLDIASREILTDELNDNQGTLCFITHDRTLIHQVANKIIKVEHGLPVVYSGDYGSYLANQNIEPSDQLSRGVNLANTGLPSNTKKNRSDEKEKQRNLENKSRRLNKRIKIIEFELKAKDAEINRLESLFANPENISDPGQLVEYGQKHKIVQKDRYDLEKEWEQLSSQLETITADLKELKSVFNISKNN